jgi:hypothetical protein
MSASFPPHVGHKKRGFTPRSIPLACYPITRSVLVSACVDNMPYGGVKDSELGREGIRYAIQDMTEARLIVMRETW